MRPVDDTSSSMPTSVCTCTQGEPCSAWPPHVKCSGPLTGRLRQISGRNGKRGRVTLGVGRGGHLQALRMQRPALRVAHPQPGRSGRRRGKPHGAHKLPPLLAHHATHRATAPGQHRAVQPAAVSTRQGDVNIVGQTVEQPRRQGERKARGPRRRSTATTDHRGRQGDAGEFGRNVPAVSIQMDRHRTRLRSQCPAPDETVCDHQGGQARGHQAGSAVCKKQSPRRAGFAGAQRRIST
jgi:hypothetical protein